MKDARERCTEARKLIAAGVGPSEKKRLDQLDAAVKAATTFKAVGDEYILKCERERRAEVTISKARWLLSLLEPSLGGRPVDQVSPSELLAVLKKIEARGHLETARRMRSFAGRVFRYAVATSRASSDPAAALRGALVAPKATHHAAILDGKRVGALLRAINGYDGQPMTQLALKLAPHVFVRPGELRQAEWAEIDLEERVWKIGAEKMKMRQPHLVPLSRQSLEVLRAAQALTGRYRYVFASLYPFAWPRAPRHNRCLHRPERQCRSADQFDLSTLVTSPPPSAALLERLLDAADVDIVSRLDMAPRAARYRPVPAAMRTSAFDAWVRSMTGTDDLRRHQSLALEAILNGQDIVLATGTASGKSLVFQAATIVEMRGGDGITLSLYPTKALASDQVVQWKRALAAAGLSPDLLGELTGDTPMASRDALLDTARIFVGTIDVFHSWLMRQVAGPAVRRFLKRLRYLVLDEAHVLEGAFGSNCAYFLRRLQCAQYRVQKEETGSAPIQIIAATATIANPAEHLERLTGRRVTVIGEEDNGAPAAVRTLALPSRGSIARLCSRCGQRSPRCSPPQCAIRCPARSNTTSGGAGRQHCVCGGAVVAPRSSSASVAGR